jgi:hypothetical protein
MPRRRPTTANDNKHRAPSTPSSKPPAGPMTLIQRKTKVQARIAGWNPDIWSDDDYCILDGETCVGRIYPELIHGESKWRWFLQTVPAPRPNSGVTATLEEAKVEFKRRYAEVKGRT